MTIIVDKLPPCDYCGARATSAEVQKRSLRKSLFQGFKMIPFCTSCGEKRGLKKHIIYELDH